jgi:hypothetical protein
VARLKLVYGYWLPPDLSAEQLMEDRDELLRSEGIDTEWPPLLQDDSQ